MSARVFAVEFVPALSILLATLMLAATSTLVAALTLVARWILVTTLTLVFWVAVPSGEAAAQESGSAAPRTVTVTFRGPPACDRGMEFLGAVEHRLPERRWRLGDQGAIRVTVTQDPTEEDGEHGTQATLTVLLEGGRTLRRTIGGADCEETVEALAFITAIALDPGAEEPLQVRASEPAPSENREQDNDAPVVALPSPSRRWSGRLGIHARALFGAAPRALVGSQLAAALSAEHAGLWAPSVRLMFSYQARGGFEQEAGTAGFTLWSGALDLCTSHARWGRASMRPCVQMEGGALVAEGSDTFAPRREVRPWATVGPAVALRATLSELLALSLRGSLGVPVVRDAFQFDADVFHQVPMLTGSVGGGLELILP